MCMDNYIQGYIERASHAAKQAERWSQREADIATMTIAKTMFDHAEELAELAVNEAGLGNVKDKIAKIKSKSSIVWWSLKDKKSVDIIGYDAVTGITEVAKPMGVVAAITPVTNPVVTPMSNAMFALKGRNAIIFTPHHQSIKTSTRAIELINEALEKNGMPKGLIQILNMHSRENTRELISSADIVIATGGAGMVKAAYSSGKPALGVGAGNVQCIISNNADVSEAIPLITKGRSYDYGIICSSEQSIIYPKAKKEEVLRMLRLNKVYIAKTAEEVTAIRKTVFTENGLLERSMVGMSPIVIAKAAGLSIPKDTSMIAVSAEGAGQKDFLSGEKMCPVISLYPYESFEEAVEIAYQNLSVNGMGHSASIHSNDRNEIEYAALQLPVSRLVVNQCSATNAGGSFFNGLNPTNTLGCGSWGGNSISENLTYKHLINIARIADYRPANKVPVDEELWQIS